MKKFASLFVIAAAVVLAAQTIYHKHQNRRNGNGSFVSAVERQTLRDAPNSDSSDLNGDVKDILSNLKGQNSSGVPAVPGQAVAQPGQACPGKKAIWTFTFAYVPQDIQDQMLADLAFMAGIQGGQATPLHQKIFGPVDGASYKKFFERRIGEIILSSSEEKGVLAFAAQGRMWLTQNFVKFSIPQVARMMFVYHEARHAVEDDPDHDGWPHVLCPDPFKDVDGSDIKGIVTGTLLAGHPACDKTPLGAYGSSVILLKNIQKYCTNCTDKAKMDAGLYADDQIKRIIRGARKELDADLQK